MLVIPAIDLMGGMCVRLVRGKPGTQTVYSHNPATVARIWEQMGATRLHVVDLDAAMTGRVSPENERALAGIIKAVKIPIELGGGIRGLSEAKRALEAGVQWVVVGTAALMKRELVSRLVQELGERLIVSLDSRDGHLVASGWIEDVDEDPADFAMEMWSMGARTLIYTSTNRDGTLEGPDLVGIRSVLQSGASVIAAGGVGSLEDLTRLRSLEPQGLKGVIIGKALYSGAVDLREALLVAEGKIP